jgi:hypothetical protein
MKDTDITFVTGIWDLNRGEAQEGWKRSFEHYINNFIRLLQEMKNHNLAIFIDKENEHIVWKYREKHNTKVFYHSKDDFGNNFFPFFDQVQSIRNNPDWYNQVAWLKDSTQGSLEYYNPMVMSKMFLLHNTKIFNPFNSTYYYWIDGGINNTLSLGYFDKQQVIKNLKNISDKFLFICFPYETTTEIHGFEINAMKKYANNQNVTRVARGGFFGGHKDFISEANGLYYSLLGDSLSQGYMGTEESIFTLMTYIDPESYRFEMIDGNGLIYLFFENLQNKTYLSFSDDNKVILYFNAFNSPEQLEMVLDSFEKYEPDLLNNTDKILINNSTNSSLFPEYDKIVQKYRFTEEIRKGNIGVCGGRQLAAEHFANTKSKYMMFFEDDMLIDYEGNCRFGFNKKVSNLLQTIIKIMNTEKYDFLKISFSEFYGNNSLQWSWHNVPSDKRIEYFGERSSKPFTQFNNIKSINSVPYVDGEIYYCNWPHIIGKEGNQKLFLDTKWQHPYEQTWMSHIYTLTKQGKIKAGLLLASPITHDRKHHYGAAERREN